jgi:hypothetical protein
MNSFIDLVPQPATRELLADLEARGLVIRLAPGRHELAISPGEAVGTPVYPACDAAHGGHLLLACTINQPGFLRFGWHDVPEEFLLIGPTDAEPLYLAIFHGDHKLLESKLLHGTLSAGDFTCMRCNFNDPETSFFTMNAGVPHGECVARASDRPPSFYVTEPSGTSLHRPDWGGCSLLLTDTDKEC